jgi:putative ABC transport system permease protein
MRGVKHDFREATRFLATNPGFAAVIVLTLGLAIGVNSTIFSVLNGVLLRPLAYAIPDELVGIWESNISQGIDRSQVATATYLDWRTRSQTFSDIGLFRYRGYTLTGAGEAQRLVTVDVTPVTFRLLGVAPLAGRTFTDDEEQPGNDSRKVVLSHGAWLRRFGGDPTVLGRTMILDDAAHTVVGIMPREFQFPANDPDVELWSPLTFNLSAMQSRPHRLYQAIGRLAPGVNIDQARREMATIAGNIAQENPESNAQWGVTLVPAHEQVVGKIGDTLWVLFGAVVLVLVIACANIANLLLARSATAAKGFALCAAFGAGRWPLLHRSLVESALLTAAGGIVGLLFAWWGTHALRPLIPANVPRASTIGLDVPVLAFTAVVTIASGLLVGLVPAWRAMKPNLLDVLQESSRGAIGGRGTRRLSDLMVVAEVGMALMLLVSAGLLIRSFANLSSVDPGYRTSGIIATHIVLPNSRYPDAPSKRRFFDSLLERVKAIPGVSRASAVSALPMSALGVQFDLPFTIDGLATTSPTERPRARYRAVMADYFQTLGIELKKGRVFDDFDGRENGPKVAIINEATARRYFGHVSDPIGQLVKMPMAGDLQIVGVVEDIKHDGLQGTSAAEVFVPYFQFPLTEMQIVMATDLESANIVPRVKGEMNALDPALPIVKVSKIEDLVSASIAQPRFNMTLLAALALCAALLAAVGVYGVVTYSVTRRTSEIGVRMALGANADTTFRLVVGGAMRVVLVGVVLGLVGAAIAGRSLQVMLFGVPPLDLITYVLSGSAIIVVGFIAASLPALRASRIDPVGALRSE